MLKRGKNVLVLDDEEDIRLIVSSILQKEGFKVVKCQSIAEAKEQVQNATFHLYFIDLNLPDGSGFEIVELIQQQVKTPPIIVISAFEGEVELAQFDRYSIHTFLKKPFKKSDILKAALSVTQ